MTVASTSDTSQSNLTLSEHAIYVFLGLLISGVVLLLCWLIQYFVVKQRQVRYGKSTDIGTRLIEQSVRAGDFGALTSVFAAIGILFLAVAPHYSHQASLVVGVVTATLSIISAASWFVSNRFVLKSSATHRSVLSDDKNQ